MLDAAGHATGSVATLCIDRYAKVIVPDSCTHLTHL